MTKYGTLFSYWSKDWDCDWLEEIRLAHEAGLDFLECHVNRTMDWSQEKIDEVVACAAENNIELIMNGGVGPDEVTYSDDPEVRQRGVELLKSYLRQAARFGSHFMDGGFSEEWPVKRPVNLTAEQKIIYLDRVVDAVKQLVPLAEELDIVMNMEITNRFEAFLVNTAAEAYYVASRVDSPYFKVTLDTFHMNIEEDNLHDGVELLGKKYVGHVHLGEANRKLPGQGSMVNFKEFFDALKKIGYTERLMVEPFILGGGSIASNVFLWRDLSGNADKEKLTSMMKESIAYIKSIWED